ncbi:MAG: hypothetical protein U0V54_10130 [Saprospiraceae bacterium]
MSCKAPSGRMPEANDVVHHGFGEEGSEGGGFYNARHTGQPVDGTFFEHAPDGKVEGIDV